MILALLVLAFVVLLGLGLLARREVRLLRAAKREYPAVLEGGGSHLSTHNRR